MKHIVLLALVMTPVLVHAQVGTKLENVLVTAAYSPKVSLTSSVSVINIITRRGQEGHTQQLSVGSGEDGIFFLVWEASFFQTGRAL